MLKNNSTIFDITGDGIGLKSIENSDIILYWI